MSNFTPGLMPGCVDCAQSFACAANLGDRIFCVGCGDVHISAYAAAMHSCGQVLGDFECYCLIRISYSIFGPLEDCAAAYFDGSGLSRDYNPHEWAEVQAPNASLYFDNVFLCSICRRYEIEELICQYALERNISVSSLYVEPYP